MSPLLFGGEELLRAELFVFYPFSLVWHWVRLGTVWFVWWVLVILFVFGGFLTYLLTFLLTYLLTFFLAIC